MSQLTLSRRSHLPTWTTDFFDTERFFPRFGFDEFPSFEFNNRMPAVNITETEKDFHIEMAVPGFERKDFKVEIDNGILFISMEKSMESKEEKRNFTRREFFFNTFKRSFTLPENCLPEKINAVYDRGILNLYLPKKEMTFTPPVREIKVS